MFFCEFYRGLADLPVAESAKRMIDGFLEDECTPCITLNPRKAKQIKKTILEEISLSLRFCPPCSETKACNINTLYLANSLRLVAKKYREAGKLLYWKIFESLADMLISAE
jgi:hypothetical protein